MGLPEHEAAYPHVVGGEGQIARRFVFLIVAQRGGIPDRMDVVSAEPIT